MTLTDLVDLIETQFPTADYSIESRILRKRAVGRQDVELEVHVWPPNRTLHVRGATPDEVWRQLEAPASESFRARVGELNVPHLARRERA